MKPCIKCGTSDRYANDRCKFCASEYRKANRVKIAEYNKEYAKEYYSANKEKVDARLKEWRKVNQDKLNAQSREWRKNNPEKAKAITERRRKNHPDAITLVMHNRRSKIKSDKPSADIITQLFIKQNGDCACCGKSLLEGFHLDHIMPLSLGGRHIDENLQLLTPRCNQRKSSKHPDMWRKELGIQKPHTGSTIS